jgi:GTP-binding protein HflX
LSAIRSQGLDLLLDAVAERLSRVARRATLRLPVSAGELRARLYAAGLVLAERIAEDGAFEIDTELSEFELLKWAREPGVEILALAGDSTCTVAGAYLQSSPAQRSSP